MKILKLILFKNLIEATPNSYELIEGPKFGVHHKLCHDKIKINLKFVN